MEGGVDTRKERQHSFHLSIHTSITQEEGKQQGVPGVVTTLTLMTGCGAGGGDGDIYLISIRRT